MDPTNYIPKDLLNIIPIASFCSLLIVIFIVYVWFYNFYINFKTSKGDRRFNSIVLNLALLICLFVAFAGELKGEFSVWFPIVGSVVMIFSNVVWQDRDPYSYLKAQKKEKAAWEPEPFPDFKKVPNVDPQKISTYPRITFFDVTKNYQEDGRVLFDSSDFESVNKVLGTAIDDYQPALEIGRELSLFEKKYSIENIRVDYLSIFDDYSFTGHTEGYKGKDVPYQIQISVRVKPI